MLSLHTHHILISICICFFTQTICCELPEWAMAEVFYRAVNLTANRMALSLEAPTDATKHIVDETIKKLSSLKTKKNPNNAVRIRYGKIKLLLSYKIPLQNFYDKIIIIVHKLTDVSTLDAINDAILFITYPDFSRHVTNYAIAKRNAKIKYSFDTSDLLHSSL